MATKNWAGDFLDPALNTLKAYAKKLVLCSDEPTTYTGAMDIYALAKADLVSGDFSGPTNGSSSGRKITIAQKDNVTVHTTGTARYLALVDTTTLNLRYVGQIPVYPLALNCAVHSLSAVFKPQDLRPAVPAISKVFHVPKVARQDRAPKRG